MVPRRVVLDKETLILLWQELSRGWNVSPWRNPFSKETILTVLRTTKLFLRGKARLLEIEGPVAVVGNLHGNFQALYRIFNKFCVDLRTQSYINHQLLFLGDYVDRGSDGLRVVLFISIGLMLFPNFCPLRGDHEFFGTNSRYGFLEECQKLFPGQDGIDIHRAANEMFGDLPVACLISKKVLCMHGGLGKDLTNLNQIRKLPRDLQEPLQGFAKDLFSADTQPGLDVEKKCKQLKVDGFVRANFSSMSDVHLYAKGMTNTGVSTTNYENSQNTRSVMTINEDLTYHYTFFKELNDNNDVVAGDPEEKMM